MSGEEEKQSEDDDWDVLEERGDVTERARSWETQSQRKEEDMQAHNSESAYFEEFQITPGAVVIRERVVLVKTEYFEKVELLSILFIDRVGVGEHSNEQIEEQDESSHQINGEEDVVENVIGNEVVVEVANRSGEKSLECFV